MSDPKPGEVFAVPFSTDHAQDMRVRLERAYPEGITAWVASSAIAVGLIYFKLMGMNRQAAFQVLEQMWDHLDGKPAGIPMTRGKGSS